MPALTPSTSRRLLLAAALLVPLVVDPLAGDTLALKRLALAGLGLGALAAEALELLGGRRLPAPLRGPDRMLLLLAAWGAVALAWAANRPLALLELAALLGMVGLLRAQRAAVRDIWDVRRAMGWIVVAGLGAVLLDSVLLLGRTETLADSQSKFASVLFAHNNIAGGFAVLLPPLGLALLVGARGLGARLLGLAPLLVVPAYVWQLRNRAGLVALVVGVGLGALLLLCRSALERGRRPSRKAVRAIVVAVLVVGLAPLSDGFRAWGKARFYEGVTWMESHGLGNLDDSGFRPLLYRKVLEMVRDSDWLGVGPGNFAVVFPRYEAELILKPHAHNDALHVLADYGLPGLLLFLGLLGAVVWELVRALVAGREEGAFVCAAGLLGSLAAFVAVGLVEVPFLFGAQALVLVLVAGLAGRLGEVDVPRSRRVLGRPARAWVALVIALLGLGLVLRRLPASWLLGRAEAAREAGRLDDAAAALEGATALGMGYALPHQMLADLALERDRPEEALEQLRRAEALWPESHDIWREQAAVLLELGRTEEAVERLARARASSPGDRSLMNEYVRALAADGQYQAAIDQLEYRLRADRLGSMDAVATVAQIYRQYAESRPDGPRDPVGRFAWIGARHFEAVLLEYGPPRFHARAATAFKHATHQLQSLPGSPDSWWPAYERFVADGGWDMPATALWTSVDADGVRLYPGWRETAGPPLPLHRR